MISATIKIYTKRSRRSVPKLNTNIPSYIHPVLSDLTSIQFLLKNAGSHKNQILKNVPFQRFIAFKKNVFSHCLHYYFYFSKYSLVRFQHYTKCKIYIIHSNSIHLPLRIKISSSEELLISACGNMPQANYNINNLCRSILRDNFVTQQNYHHRSFL